MTASTWLLALVLALATVAAVVALRARRRARTAAARRDAAVARLGDALDRVLAELEELPWPRRVALAGATAPPGDEAAASLSPPPRPAIADPVTGLPARAALIDDLDHRVGDARQEGRRLGLALVAVESGGPTLERTIARVARVLHDVAPGGAAYRAGERSLALVLPDAGRADALAAVARLEASLDGSPPITSRATELLPGDDAADLLSRVLAATG
jgi:GGDEF domain-containing protein